MNYYDLRLKTKMFVFNKIVDKPQHCFGKHKRTIWMKMLVIKCLNMKFTCMKIIKYTLHWYSVGLYIYMIFKKFASQNKKKNITWYTIKKGFLFFYDIHDFVIKCWLFG